MGTGPENNKEQPHRINYKGQYCILSNSFCYLVISSLRYKNKHLKQLQGLSHFLTLESDKQRDLICKRILKVDRIT
jgi:hypothetical protein